MQHPPFKKIISKNTSGDVLRDDLISDWYLVYTETGNIIHAYYHLFYGWMCKGKAQDQFIYGYIPVIDKIIKYEKI